MSKQVVFLFYIQLSLKCQLNVHYIFGQEDVDHILRQSGRCHLLCRVLQILNKWK